MIIYKVLVSHYVLEKLVNIAAFVDSKNIFPFGENYINELVDEIMELSYRADTIPKLQWRAKKKYNPREKRLLVKNGKFAVFFHTYYSYVLIDDIVPSKLVSKKV